MVLPDGYTPDRDWPTLLTFPPGGQSVSMVTSGLDWWEAEAKRRGFIVLSPAAPGGDLFFNGSRELIRPLAEAFLALYPVQGNQLHVGGISNGGISASAAALDHPDLFLSITVLPGFPRDANADLASIGHMKINMFAGESDAAWVERMVETNAALTALGADVFMEIVPGAGHTMPSLAGPGASRFFDLLP